uniref:L-aminoadipate-semialdehyde dehydrogenase-phosphopantetheinyl transferase n=1 Tax=Salvator merianae TaxID=96440 RepID=A0A8D0C4X0_SALMN
MPSPWNCRALDLLISMRRLAMESVRWAFPYYAWVPRRQDWLLAMRVIQPEERERIEQFVFRRDAKAAMAGRLLLRKYIAEKLNIPWQEIKLQRTSKGKPVLANELNSTCSSCSFNISHQGNYAVLAAESDCQVGIDITKTSLPGSGSIPNFFRIMRRQFTEKEWSAIMSMENEWLQLDMFHRHWALKESFIKAIGVGIGFELQRIEFNVSPVHLEVGKTYNETIMLLDGEEEKEWTFQALSSDMNQTTFTMLTFDDLMTSAEPLAPEDPACWDSFCSKQESPARQNSNER